MAVSRWALPVIALIKDISRVYWVLLKIMVPALIMVKIADSLGLTRWLAWLLSPLMSLVGLPESMGIVWATAMLTNIYTAMAVFFPLFSQASLSVAQVTTLGAMILIAHSLPIEGAVAKAAGIRWRTTLLIRIGGALVIGSLLHIIYQTTDTLQHKSQLLWQPDIIDNSLPAWAITQIETLLSVLIVIAVLMTLLKILRVVGIEKWMHWLLFPVLRFLGLSRESANITVIGMTLGLSFGGGLLIDEARSGKLSHRDVFLSMALLGLCHSLIEDTLLIVLLGAHLSGILWMRIVFAVIVVALLARLWRITPKQTSS